MDVGVPMGMGASGGCGGMGALSLQGGGEGRPRCRSVTRMLLWSSGHPSQSLPSRCAPPVLARG
jgi:hypothetical protein